MQFCVFVRKFGVSILFNFKSNSRLHIKNKLTNWFIVPTSTIVCNMRLVHWSRATKWSDGDSFVLALLCWCTSFVFWVTGKLRVCTTSNGKIFVHVQNLRIVSVHVHVHYWQFLCMYEKIYIVHVHAQIVVTRVHVHVQIYFYAHVQNW